MPANIDLNIANTVVSSFTPKLNKFGKTEEKICCVHGLNTETTVNKHKFAPLIVETKTTAITHSGAVNNENEFISGGRKRRETFFRGGYTSFKAIVVLKCADQDLKENNGDYNIILSLTLDLMGCLLFHFSCCHCFCKNMLLERLMKISRCN